MGIGRNVTATATTTTQGPPPGDAPDLKGPRRLGDRGFALIALLAGLSVLAILVLIAYSTTKEAWPIFAHDAKDFFFSTRWAPNEGKFGSLAFVYGTFVTSVIALVFAVPLSSASPCS